MNKRENFTTENRPRVRATASKGRERESERAKRNASRRVGCATATVASLFLAGGSAHAGLNLTPATKDLTDTLSDVAGLVSGVGGAIGAGASALQFIGVLPNADADVLNELEAIQYQLGQIPVMIYADSKLQSALFVQNLLGQAQAGLEIAVENYSSTHQLLALTSSLGPTVDNDTLLAVNPLRSVSGNVATESNPYFEALYLASATDGPSTTTAGVTMNAEWKQIMSFRVPHSGSFAFDWREGLGALAGAVEARLGALALIASTSDPSRSILNVNARFDGDAYAGEVMRYEEALATRLEQVDSQLHCRESIWAVGKTAGDVDYKWFCTDVSSGISGISEKRATLNYSRSDPNWNCTVTYDGRGVPHYGSPCYNLHWSGPQLYWGTTRLVNSVVSQNGSVYDPTVTAVFRSYAPVTSQFSDILAHGQEDAMNDLLTELGVFGVQRTLDHVENVWQGTSQPAVNTLIRNWDTGLCLDLDPFWVGAETLATGKSQMIAGYPFVLSDCSKPTAPWTATWDWDATTGEIRNLVYEYFAGQRWCIASSSTRGQTPVVTAQCDGSAAQKWTWNSASGVFRNAGAAMATLVANGTAIKSPIVIGSPLLEQNLVTGGGWGGF